MRITSTNIICNLIAGPLLMQRFGVTGAAMAVVIGVAAGAMLRRWTLRRSFGVIVPIYHSAGPLAAALVAIGAALAVRDLAVGMPMLFARGAALGVGLLGYALGLKLWMTVAGEDWSLGEFGHDAAEPLPS
jgi:hypothetical protein